MSDIKLKNISDIIDDYDYFIFDIWGVILEDKVIDSVVAKVNKLITMNNKQVLFLSNAPRPAEISCGILRNLGIENIEPKDVFTSGDMARKMLQDKNFLGKYNISDIPNIFHIGADTNSDILANIPHNNVSKLQDADMIVLTLYSDQGKERPDLEILLRDVANSNIPVLCANPDIKLLMHDKKIRYCAGFFTNKIIEYGGTKVIYTGKPYIDIYNLAFSNVKNMANDKNRVLMIGDTVETDILGAKNASIHSALVMTGNSRDLYNNDDNLSKEEKLSLINKAFDKKDVRPNFVIEI